MASSGKYQPRVSELYNPKILTIEVGSNGHIFKVAHGLICPMSDYFDKAFSKRWKAGQTCYLQLLEVEEWIFECFFGWLYNRTLSWDPAVEPDTSASNGKKRKAPANESDSPKKRSKRAYMHRGELSWKSVESENSSSKEQAGDKVGDNMEIDQTEAPPANNGDEYDENDPQDPVTWPYHRLFKLYVFADEYDTHDFRTCVLDIIQLKVLQNSPRGYLWPHEEEYAFAFHNLPKSNGLYRFLVDMIVFDLDPRPMRKAKLMECFPNETLAIIVNKTMQLDRLRKCQTSRGNNCDHECHPEVNRLRPDYFYDICEYHEHQSDEEKAMCQAKWKVRIEKHQMYMQIELD